MKQIAILGAGESGLGAAMLAKREGYAVFVSDGGKISESRKAQLLEAEIGFGLSSPSSWLISWGIFDGSLESDILLSSIFLSLL